MSCFSLNAAISQQLVWSIVALKPGVVVVLGEVFVSSEHIKDCKCNCIFRLGVVEL